MQDGLYHRTVYFPVGITKNIPLEYANIYYSKHAMSIAKERDIKLPNTILCAEESIFEVRIQDGCITTACFRLPYSTVFELSVVFRYYEDKIVAITVWKNELNKPHPIQECRYVQAN